jgi:hypothetical protein
MRAGFYDVNGLAGELARLNKSRALERWLRQADMTRIVIGS